MKISIKTITAAAAALSLMAGSAALAQPYGNGDGRGPDRNDRQVEQRHDNGRGNDDRQVGQRRDKGHHYKRGQRLDSRYQTSRYQVDYRKHKLRAPPRGYQWRQVDNDYVLAAVATGLIAEIISGR